MQKIISLVTALVLAALPIRGLAQSEHPEHPEHPEQSQQAEQSRKPRLVVNIVVSGLPYDLLERFRTGFSGEGFARFAAGGMQFSAAHFDYMQTLSPTGIATITTGANPSMHGIVAGSWVDYVTGDRVGLVADDGVSGVGGDAGRERYSPLHIVMPTVGDKLLSESPQSKVVSIAADPVSAIVAGGQSGTAYWMDPQRAVWVSSTAYMTSLPRWVTSYNTARPANTYAGSSWIPARPIRQYLNRSYTIFGAGGPGGVGVVPFRRGTFVDYAAMVSSPFGNTLVADFAREAVIGEGLGTDDTTDLLNVCFDASRTIGERFGSGAMEVEDMVYRLDMDLGGLVRAISSRVGMDRVLFVVTSDHGMTDGWNTDSSHTDRVERDRFNVAQFKTILNSFMAVQFGSGDWVLDYIDRQVYLNRNLVYQKGLNLEDVQNRAAAFVLQFRGVSHVLTSTALAGGYFGSGYGAKMQNSFYPRRGGDLMINLMSGWIEDRPETQSLPGSMYDRDTHVPLMMLGWRITAGRRVDAEVDMTRLAPTIARFMGIGRPAASDGVTLPGFDDIF